MALVTRLTLHNAKKALKQTYHLRGIPNTVHMRTTVLPGGGSHGQLFRPSWPSQHSIARTVSLVITNPVFYRRGGSKSKGLEAIGWELKNSSPTACVWRWGSIKDLCVQINLYTTQRKDWSTHTNSVVEPYAVDSTVYLIGTARLIDVILDWKRGCLENSELKNIAFTAIRRPNSWISDVNWIDEMQEYTKLIARWMLPTFWGVSARWNICLYPENLPRKRPKVWRKSTRRWVKQQSPKSYFN